LFAPSQQDAKQTQRLLKNPINILRHALGITFAPLPFVLDEGASKMQMSSISIFAVGSAVIAPMAVFLRYLSKQPPKVANTSQELLDLFDDRCALLEEDATVTSPNEASERFTATAPDDLAPENASSSELSTSAKECQAYRSEPEHSLQKKQSWESPLARYCRFRRGEKRAVSLADILGRRRKESSI
jgi:hypothetical protein